MDRWVKKTPCSMVNSVEEPKVPEIPIEIYVDEEKMKLPVTLFPTLMIRVRKMIK